MSEDVFTDMTEDDDAQPMPLHPEKTPVVLRHARWCESRIRSLAEGGASMTEIAMELEVSLATASKYVNVLEIPIKPSNRGALKNDERNRQMLVSYQSGKTLAEVGADYGVTRERVRQVLQHSFPDIVIPKRRRSWICSHCGAEFSHRSSDSFCSLSCRKSAKADWALTRNDALVIMGMRDNGKTWGAIGVRLKKRNIRQSIRKYAPLLFSTEEREKYLPKR